MSGKPSVTIRIPGRDLELTFGVSESDVEELCGYYGVSFQSQMKPTRSVKPVSPAPAFEFGQTHSFNISSAGEVNYVRNGKDVPFSLTHKGVVKSAKRARQVSSLKNFLVSLNKDKVPPANVPFVDALWAALKTKTLSIYDEIKTSPPPIPPRPEAKLSDVKLMTGQSMLAEVPVLVSQEEAAPEVDPLVAEFIGGGLLPVKVNGATTYQSESSYLAMDEDGSLFVETKPVQDNVYKK